MNHIINEFYVNKRLWGYLAKSDVKSRFRRSRLGVLWPAVQQLAFSIGAGFIWANVFGLDPVEFIPFITLGFAIWGAITSSFIDGSVAFVNAAGYMKQLPISNVVFIARVWFVQLIYFSIALVVAVLVLFASDVFSIYSILLSIPGLILLQLFSFFTIGVFSYLGVRYRDVTHGISSFMSLLFVVTPIIYPAELLVKKGLGFLIFLNPFGSLIEIIRFPLINGIFPDSMHYFIVIGMVTFMFGFYLLINAKWRSMVSFWV